MHHFFQAFEVAIVHIGLHKIGPWTHVRIAQSGNLELRVELRREFDPLSIRIQLTAIAFQRAQEGSDPCIDVRASGGIRIIAALVGPALVVDL